MNCDITLYAGASHGTENTRTPAAHAAVDRLTDRAPNGVPTSSSCRRIGPEVGKTSEGITWETMCTWRIFKTRLGRCPPQHRVPGTRPRLPVGYVSCLSQPSGRAEGLPPTTRGPPSWKWSPPGPLHAVCSSLLCGEEREQLTQTAGQWFPPRRGRGFYGRNSSLRQVLGTPVSNAIILYRAHTCFICFFVYMMYSTI